MTPAPTHSHEPPRTPRLALRAGRLASPNRLISPLRAALVPTHPDQGQNALRALDASSRAAEARRQRSRAGHVDAVQPAQALGVRVLRHRAPKARRSEVVGDCLQKLFVPALHVAAPVVVLTP